MAVTALGTSGKIGDLKVRYVRILVKNLQNYEQSEKIGVDVVSETSMYW